MNKIGFKNQEDESMMKRHYWLLEIMLHKRPDDCCTLVRSKAGPNASVIARVSLLFTAIKPARYHQSDTRIATVQPITAPLNSGHNVYFIIISELRGPAWAATSGMMEK